MTDPPLPPESGYEAWLRYQQPGPGAGPGPYRQALSHVAMVGCSSLVRTAWHDLRHGLGLMLGVFAEPAEPAAPAANGLMPPQLLVGTADELRRAGLVDLGQAGVLPLPADGFALVPLPAGAEHGSPGAPSLAIVGADDAGCLYGSFALLRRLATGVALPVSAPEHEAPVMLMRIVEHWDNIDGSVERGYAGKSVFFADGEVTADLARVSDYARLLGSVGINVVAVNNVNVDEAAMALLTPHHLRGLARVAAALRSYGVHMVLSVSFASPAVLGRVASSDPTLPQVASWWSQTVSRVYEHIPDLAGFLVKAGSEGQPGPHDYGCTDAQGANVIARALQPYGGKLLWRCFVYNCHQDWRDQATDRARAAYDQVEPLDGDFCANVVLQVKQGPMDFQVREPPSPLLGAMPGTPKALEVQLTQEYTGQQVHLCYLVPSWAEVLGFDTQAVTAMAGVANVGDEPNWTGHLLAQANLYGFGRLAWDGTLPPAQVAREWSQMTFGPDEGVTSTVVQMLVSSKGIYESYTAPLGLGWMVSPGGHYGPSVDGYEYDRWGTYHRADHDGVGIDRTSASGTGFTAQYRQPWQALFEDIERCPEELLLFFHRVAYSHRLVSGKTVLQHIYDSHFEGAAQAQQLLSRWRSLEGRVDTVRYRGVERRLVGQAASAAEWRDVVNAYFRRKSGVPDERGRTVY